MNNFLRLFLVRWIVALLMMPGLCFALSPSTMQKSISLLIQNKAIQRGAVAGGAGVTSTLGAIGADVVGTAAAAAVVTAAGVTAPAWITAAVVMGLGALIGAGVLLAVDGASQWYFNSDGTVKLQTAGAVVVDYSQMARPNDPALAASCTPQLTYNWCDQTHQFTSCAYPGSFNPTLPCKPGYSATTASSFGEAMQQSGYSYQTKPGDSTTQTKSISDAIDALTPQEKAKPLNPQVLAAIANAAWEQASLKPGYIGMPYDAANPITAADATALQQTNPSFYPTVSDAVSPQPSTSTDPAESPWVLPVTTVTTPDTGSDPATDPKPQKVEIDWGVFTPPGLEETPSIASIIDPLLNLWPTWSKFAFPPHASECPMPTYTLPHGVLNGQAIHFTQMCDFLEISHVREAMQAAFTVAWAIMIVFIVMGA
jgi:hypothetical protein